MTLATEGTEYEIDQIMDYKERVMTARLFDGTGNGTQKEFPVKHYQRHTISVTGASVGVDNVTITVRTGGSTYNALPIRPEGDASDNTLAVSSASILNNTIKGDGIIALDKALAIDRIQITHSGVTSGSLAVNYQGSTQ